MFVKKWEEKTTVSQISFQCTLFEITKKYICLLKIADTSFKLHQLSTMLCVFQEFQEFV